MIPKIALNQSELCGALGITRATVENLEQGDDPIPSITLPGVPERLYPVDAVSAWATRQFTKQTTFRPKRRHTNEKR